MLAEEVRPIGLPDGQRAPSTRIVVLGMSSLLLGSSCLLLIGILSDVNEGNEVLFLVAAAFATYLWLECYVFLRRTSAFAILNPVFLATLLHFFLSYVLPATVALYDPWLYGRFSEYFAVPAQQLSEALLLVALAAFCMWRGYYFGVPMARGFRKELRNMSGLRQGLRPALVPLLGLQFVYFALVAFAIERGVFGIAGSAADRAANLGLLDLLRSGMMAGALALLLLLIYIFRCRAAGKLVWTLSAIGLLLITLNVLTGAISGFKSQVVMPFVMLAFAKFVAIQKISLGYLLATCLALVMAYQVIEPYRAYLHANSVGGQADVGMLLDALQKSQEQKDLVNQSSVPLVSQIGSRFDLTGMTAIGIAFVDGAGHVDGKAAEFAESIYLAPLLAFIPRFLWLSKPSYSSGVWFNSVVLGKTEDTSTSVGMGPVTWLYVMGGLFGVAIGFFCLGLVQALMFDGVARAGAGGFVIYLSAAMTLIMIPTDVGPALTGMLRMLPLAFVAQYLLLRPGCRVRPV